MIYALLGAIEGWKLYWKHRDCFKTNYWRSSMGGSPIRNCLLGENKECPEQEFVKRILL